MVVQPFQIDLARLQSLVAGVASYGWIFEWGMFVFLLVAFGEAAWVFIDSSQKRKADKALVPRIMTLVGIFLILPAFIFRYTGNADGVTTRVQLLAQPGQPLYEGALTWNVSWLIAGYGPMIALLALLGVAVSTVAAIIYATTASRSRPSTEFISALNNQFGELRQEIQSVKTRPATPTVGPNSAATVASGLSSAPQQADGRRSAATVIERPSAAATIIEVPGGGAELRAVSGTSAGRTWRVPSGEAKIGRDAACLVAVDDGKASREHAKIRLADGVWSINDLGSSNGTFVNDSKIAGQTPLGSGDLIRIGDTVLAFQPSS